MKTIIGYIVNHRPSGENRHGFLLSNFENNRLRAFIGEVRDLKNNTEYTIVNTKSHIVIIFSRQGYIEEFKLYFERDSKLLVKWGSLNFDWTEFRNISINTVTEADFVVPSHVTIQDFTNRYLSISG